MKTKPTRHKETNTFKFKPFSERVNDIDVDVFHKVAHRNEVVSEETESYFYQCLNKWNFLNLSENYCKFRKEVADIITLPQLLNRKQYVINTLLKYLRLKDPLCLQSIFELVIAVAKDLQIDFYEYFLEFLAAIIDLLQTKDAEQLEQSFTTLAYLFKFQWRYMIKNIDKIFDLLVPLLTDTRPIYVNNFAAESFAFVVRKVKDKEAFLKLVLSALEKRKDGVVGCGKLLFHVIAGVPGQFHSCTESMLSVYLNALQDPLINQQLLFEVLTTIFNCIGSEIHPQKCDVLWTVIFKLIDKFPDNFLLDLLRLIQVLIKHKGGQMLKDPAAWTKKLTELIDKYQDNVLLLKEIANASLATLLAPNVKLLQETSSFLILKLLSINNQDLLARITEGLIVYSSFETLVLPNILKKSTFSTLNEKFLQLLVKIIQIKSPPSLGGINFDKWSKFSLNLRDTENVTFLSEHLDSLKEGDIQENALKVLIILPHLPSLQKQLNAKMIDTFKSLYKRVLEKNDQQQKINFAFLLALECIARLTKEDEFHSLINELSTSTNSDLLSAVNLHENDVSMLNALDLNLTYLKNSKYSNEYINQAAFDNLHKSLVSKLGSPNSLIRLTTAHLYSLFSTVPALTHEHEYLKMKNALELALLAESQQVTVHKYRDRLLHVQALDFHGAAVSHLNSNYYDYPLHYLFGNLYVNFSLLWEPVCQVISSYATKECPQFWEVFMSKLKSKENVTMVEKPSFACETLTVFADQLFALKDKIDYENYKLLLWKCMGQVISYCEVKNRDYVGLFIDFVETNFFRSNSEDAKSCSIKKRENEQEQTAEIDETLDKDVTMEDVEEKNEENEKEKEDEKKKEEEEEASKSKMGRTDRVKLLLAMLQVFSKFTNTRSLYREPEILKIYLDLLSSKNSEIQKSALACIYTYKYKYLVPYKSHLDNIVDEANLKNELARFQISVNDGGEVVVQDEHRAGLIPVLMRILHAKMTQRVGMRTGGKFGGIVRRKTILRFLAGVKEDEMMVFVRIAFKPFQNYLPILTVDEKDQAEVNLPQMVQDIIRNVNLECVIPPKRLQSAVNLLAVIIEQFGGKMTEKLLPHLLALVICILAQVVGILARSSEVHAGYLTSIRNVRNGCINILVRFFAHFENYDWSSDEVNALFAVAVFPWLDKLPVEGIHSPTPLLKMMATWGHNPRYYPFFVKLNKNNETSLVFIIRLLLGPKTQKSVIHMILDIIEKMLTLQDFEKEDPDQMEVDEDKPKSLLLTVTNKLNIVKSDSINYGSATLLPHVTDILTYIERNLKRQARQGASRTELTILSRISEFVSDPKTCDTLLTLVLPILHRKSNDSEETVIQLLTTVTNLIKHVEKPEIHLRPILHLLAQISAAPARKMLMELLNIVAKEDKTMRENQAILTELNAYDQRWIDQPDFQRRLDAFDKIDNMVKENEMTLEFGVAVILNCFFFLKIENDLAMRDRSGQCLKSMGVHLAKRFSECSTDRKYLIEETILTMLRHGIRNKNENVKMQSIAFLGHMSMECSEVHPVLRDLNGLTNKQDPEVDFFENMQHLQLHRRARALLKFCSVSKTMTKAPNPKTLTQFVLPLASSYLCNEKFANKNSIIDAAIETVGVVCRLLPWNQYEIVLRYYLDKLRTCTEFQRQAIRIVVAILDSFHFDLSKLKFLDEEGLKAQEETNKDEESTVKPDSTEELSTEEAPKPSDESEKPEEPEEMTDEHLDEVLNSEPIVDTAPEEIDESKKDVPAVEKQTVLSQYMAKRLVNSISKGFLPQLHKAITVKTKHEGSHKVNKKRVSSDQEEEELMRVPIALAMVKLLQKLPHGMLDSNLRGIFMKICTFLKSRLESVRRTTREILQKIMATLGPNYLHHLLKEMNALLTRGYQVHVLSFTIHAVLVSLKPFLQPSHMRSNLSLILSVCKIDLFGPSAEEKEIAGIVKNVSEARSTKSFDIFHILGEFIDEGSLINTVLPLKEVLLRTHSHKTVRKITESLRQVGLGLVDNKFIEIDKMINFLYSVASESIPQLMPENMKKDASEEEKKKKEAAKQKQDIFIIAPAPKNRMGIKASAKSSKNTNAHVMIEFGLRLFHILLKRDKVNDPELKPLIDPFVPVLSSCLKSQHVKLSTLALQCLNWILKMDLPTVRTLAPEICTSMFSILHKYAVAGLSKGDNYDLVMAAFKTMSVLVRDVKHLIVAPEQLKALLMYAEQDIHDGEKQATAFGLLKAIIHRKLMVPEMDPVMGKVAKLSVTSELENVRKQARAVFYTYLIDYPLGKKRLEAHISFYLAQLRYELQPGRLSVLEMIYGIVTGFPLEVLVQHSEVIFTMVGVRLVNDDDPICKKVCAKCIQEMIVRVPHNQKSKLFKKAIQGLKDKKLMRRRLAVQLCGLFVSAEKEAFESRFSVFLPLLSKQFYLTSSFTEDDNEPGRFVKIQKAETEEELYDGTIRDPERLKDHHLFMVLTVLLKICANCTGFLKDQKYKGYVDTFAEHSQSLLAHPHLWVRLGASQVLGFILSALDTEKVIRLMESPEECDPDDGYIYSDPVDKLRSLVLDSTAQLQPEMEFEQLYEQIIKNLVFIAKLLKITSAESEDDKKDKEDDKDGENNKPKVTVLWLLKKLRKYINLEVSTAPKSTVVRSSVFKWMAGVIATIDIDSLKPILFHFMSPLAREMATIEESNAPLRQLAKEVATMIKKKTSIEDYTRLLSQAQQRLDKRRAEKKKVRSQQYVTDPELAAKRKIAKQQKKKVMRKRKIENLKGKKGVIRKKMKKDVDLEVM